MTAGAMHSGSRRSILTYSIVLPVAALTGAIAVQGVEAGVFVGVALVGSLVVLIGSMSRHRLLVGRIVLWLGLLLSLGIKPPRRSGGEVISSPLTFANTAPVVALVVAVGVALVLCRVRLLPLTRAEIWLALFLGVALASSFWSVSPAHSALRALTLVASYLALIVLARAVARDGTDALGDLNAVVHALMATVVIGVMIMPTAALAAIPGALAPVGRLKGVLLYVHPNALAFLAVIGIVLAVAGVRFGPWSAGWLVRGSAIALDVGILLATRTRSALVLLVLAAALGAVLDRRLRRRLVIMVPAIAALVFVVLQLGGANIGGFVAREQSTEQLTGLTGRVEEWDRALAIAGSSPLVGHGYYAGHRFGELADLEGELNTTTDNAWVDVAIDLGVVGLVPLLAFVLVGGAQLVRAYRARERAAEPALVVFAVCVAASFVNPSLNESNYWMLVLGFVILAVAPGLAPTVRPGTAVQAEVGARRRSRTTSS